MILVKVELHNANTGAVTELGRAMIYNDGTSPSPMYGNYTVVVHDKDDAPQSLPSVTDWPRLAHNAWQLIGRALKPIF